MKITFYNKQIVSLIIHYETLHDAIIVEKEIFYIPIVKIASIMMRVE